MILNFEPVFLFARHRRPKGHFPLLERKTDPLPGGRSGTFFSKKMESTFEQRAENLRTVHPQDQEILNPRTDAHALTWLATSPSATGSGRARPLGEVVKTYASLIKNGSIGLD